MATTSDGKGDPPDPPNAHHNTDALRIPCPSMQQAHNDSIPTEIDEDMDFYDMEPSKIGAPTHPLARRSDHDKQPSNDHLEFYDIDTDATPDPPSSDGADDTVDADMMENYDDNDNKFLYLEVAPS